MGNDISQRYELNGLSLCSRQRVKYCRERLPEKGRFLSHRRIFRRVHDSSRILFFAFFDFFFKIYKKAAPMSPPRTAVGNEWHYMHDLSSLFFSAANPTRNWSRCRFAPTDDSTSEILTPHRNCQSLLLRSTFWLCWHACANANCANSLFLSVLRFHWPESDESALPSSTMIRPLIYRMRFASRLDSAHGSLLHAFHTNRLNDNHRGPFIAQTFSEFSTLSHDALKRTDAQRQKVGFIVLIIWLIVTCLFVALILYRFFFNNFEIVYYEKKYLKSFKTSACTKVLRITY